MGAAVSADWRLVYKAATDSFRRDVQAGDWNLTYNLSPMLAEVSGGQGLSTWLERRRGQRAYKLLDDAQGILSGLQDSPVELAHLNPENGWGSYELLLEVWSDFVQCIEAHPDAVLDAWL